MPRRARFYGRPGLNVDSYDVRAELDRHLFEDPVPFYLDQARKGQGPVLELGCGTGRIAAAIAGKTGRSVVGLDISPAMLDVARTASDAVGWLAGDMAGFALNRRFDLILIPMRGLMELTDPADQRRCLERIRAHLTPPGRLAFDLLDPDLATCLPAGDDSPVVLPPLPLAGSEDRVRVTIGARRNDPILQILEEDWRFERLRPDGTVRLAEEETHRLRWIYRSEMLLLLEVTGFEVLESYSGFTGTPPAYGADQVWICRRAR